MLAGILLPVVLLIGLNTWSLYHQTLASLNTAYDRTLLASAKSISEQLDVKGFDEEAQLRAIVPYSALEAFEADNQSQMFYRVSTLKGEMVSGFEDLPMWHGSIPARPPYAALVDFYDDRFRDRDVRVAVLLQPVASSQGRAMAVIQVAETLEVRETLALQILRNTLLRQALLIAVIAFTVVLVVQRATQPVRQLSQQLLAPGGIVHPLHQKKSMIATNPALPVRQLLPDHSDRRFMFHRSNRVKKLLVFFVGSCIPRCCKPVVFIRAVFRRVRIGVCNCNIATHANILFLCRVRLPLAVVPTVKRA